MEMTIARATDNATSPQQDATVPVAQARGVPLISSKQALDWTVARDASSFRSFSWNGTTLGFTLTTASGADGLQGMLPRRFGGRDLASLTRDGAPVTFTTATLKGIEYALFTAAAGTYAATYP